MCLASNDRGGASGGPLNPVAPEQCLESSAEEGPPKGSRFPPREIGRDLGRLSRDGLASQPGDDANGQPVRERDPETLAASTSSRGSGGWSDRPSDGSFHSFSRSLRPPPLPPSLSSSLSSYPGSFECTASAATGRYRRRSWPVMPFFAVYVALFRSACLFSLFYLMW